MPQPHPSASREVDHLLRNAELRNDLEPFSDESIGKVDTERMPTPAENEFLALMLEWERAPTLPISRWFEPELKLPPPETLDENAIRNQLWKAIHRLFEQQIVLNFTDHLADRELYCLIYRGILPAQEKKLGKRETCLHWDCASIDDNPDIWLRYYACEEERRIWSEETLENLPSAAAPPHPRNLPKESL